MIYYFRGTLQSEKDDPLHLPCQVRMKKVRSVRLG
jgi:hypothetical protein